MGFTLFLIFGFAMFSRHPYLFEEPGFVFWTMYIGFLCANHKELGGMDVFSLQRYNDRISAALVVMKTLFYRSLIFISLVHLICMLGYITTDRVLEQYAAAQFYFLNILNFNITCMITYCFSMIYGKVKGLSLYLLILFAGISINTVYSNVIYIYEIVYITSSSGSAATGMQRLVNVAVAYIIVAMLMVWLWGKYKKADLKI